MQHISKSVAEIEKMVDQLGRIIERQRQAGIQDYGWSPDCECHDCGDTGTDPKDNTSCWCEIGRALGTRKEREASWPDSVPAIHLNNRLETHPMAKAREHGATWLAEDYPQNLGLVLSGSVGSGKTGLAVSLAYVVHMDGKPVRVSTFTEILDEMRPQAASGNPETAPGDLYKPYLLVLDDLGTQKVTEYVSERLFAIVDGRHQRNLPTIITTNLDLDQLEAQFGKRVVSRIVESSRFVTLSGPDLRYRKVRAA